MPDREAGWLLDREHGVRTGVAFESHRRPFYEFEAIRDLIVRCAPSKDLAGFSGTNQLCRPRSSVRR